MDTAALSAYDAAAAVAAGELTSEQLVASCLERIRAHEDTIGAWTWIDPEHALAQARAADEARRAGHPTGPLHGVPVGVKDIIDTHDMPTENGSPLYAGRRPGRDATVVSLLRAAGAVIMGKTVSTEFAVYSPGKTANPHDPTRTPGGSSSGSAAAVAAGMVPLALGSQTNGSIIRPASFCGVVGYKPTHGTISRTGALLLSRTLDTIGVFARSVVDAALGAQTLMAFDSADPDMRAQARPSLARTASEEPPVTPQLAFARTPVWQEADAATRDGFAELADALGRTCDEVELPAPFDQAVDWHRAIMYADLAKNLGPDYERGADQISAELRAMIEEGQSVRAVDYNRALDRREVLNAGLDQVFERYDAIVTPAAPSEAPAGLESTGSPIFCTLWSLCGTPAVSLPLLRGENGLPVGVQLVGPRGDDARLLRTARWLVQHVETLTAL